MNTKKQHLTKSERKAEKAKRDKRKNGRGRQWQSVA